MLNKFKVGLALGGFVSFLHVIWSILVATNYAKPLTDFIFKVHMMQSPLIINEFDWRLSVSLIIITAIVGFVVGFIFACFYNWANKGAKKKK